MTSGLVSGEAGLPLDRTGQKVGPYRLTERLGAGGMGVVYRAVDERDDREVALKLLLPEHVGDEQRRRRFVRETSITRALDHPGIARMHDAGEVDGEVFLAMDLAAGQTLTRVLAASPGGLPIARAVTLARGIATAVAHAHDLGIVHRDLKPSNLAVDGDQVRVLDFGLAKLRESASDGAHALLYGAETETSVTHEGRILGTPSYMAPEQALGREASFRADVFSLGAVLYEMLGGTRPFVGARAMEILVSVTRDAPRPLAELRPDVPPALAKLVERCLAKKPDDRPTMSELADELAEPALLEAPVVHAAPSAASAPSAPARSPAPSSAPSPRRRSAAVLGIAVLAVGAALGAAALRSSATAPAVAAHAGTDGATLASVDAGPAVIRLVDLPLPPSTSAAALAELRSARVDETEGDIDAEFVKLEHVLALDPSLASAHLELAMRLAFLEANRAHEQFAEAVKLRHLLTDRERELLDAYRPLFQSDPPDLDACVKRLEALVARRPGDLELLNELATAYGAMGNFDADVAVSEQELALDPHFSLAYAELTQAEAYLGKFAEARASITRCLEGSPTASWCIWVREFLDGMDGDCASNEADARRRIASDPTIPDGYKALLYSLAAEGRPDAQVDEALAQTLQRVVDPGARARLGARFEVRIAAMRGDFTTAIARAAEVRAQVASRTDVAEHADAAYQSALVEDEVGHTEAAGRLAREFLDRRDVWADDPMPHDYAIATDRTALIASIAFHDRGIDAARYASILARYRETWTSRLRGAYRGFAWVYGYALPAETAEEARQALAALPTYGPVPPWIPNGDVPRFGVGRTLWLGGREAEGTRYLAAQAHACEVVQSPIGWVRANAWLGDALAKAGDVPGACAAYDVVLARWGHARPRSVTADHVRPRARALGCAPSPAR